MKIDVRCEPREALEARKCRCLLTDKRFRCRTAHWTCQQNGAGLQAQEFPHNRRERASLAAVVGASWQRDRGWSRNDAVFVEKLQNGYELERTQAHGPTIMTAKSIESPWDAAVQKYSPGLKGTSTIPLPTEDTDERLREMSLPTSDKAMLFLRFYDTKAELK